MPSAAASRSHLSSGIFVASVSQVRNRSQLTLASFASFPPPLTEHACSRGLLRANLQAISLMATGDISADERILDALWISFEATYSKRSSEIASVIECPKCFQSPPS